MSVNAHREAAGNACLLMAAANSKSERNQRRRTMLADHSPIMAVFASIADVCGQRICDARSHLKLTKRLDITLVSVVVSSTTVVPGRVVVVYDRASRSYISTFLSLAVHVRRDLRSQPSEQA